MRLESWSRVGVRLCLALALFAVGCSDHRDVAQWTDGGTPDSGLSSEGDAEVTVVLAPSGAAVEPAVTVMSSGKFQLVGAMSIGSGGASASERYELRSAPFEARR